MDIMVYTTSVSDSTSPDAIIIFCDYRVDLKPVLVQIDNNMPMETVVGDASASFLFNNGINSQNYQGNLYSVDAVALVFAKDGSSNVGGQFSFNSDKQMVYYPLVPN
ncbi:hypothetical protein Ddye_017961 [Dipteronia dyeriana]|uniref:Uncharacterized protein n=1 Tax=Dipteronia dyeriana TaxID=168575 RepID=A0AAD9UAE4_9ROSI|nr:hypothetical protein Ddye_017961 [Dipteronia dyeriana]